MEEEQKLLQSLLETIPDQPTQIRPVTLRSREEQRRFALRSFLQRTWVDYALVRVERLLVIAVVGFFCFWLVDGYGRDWLYAQGLLTPQPVQSGVATQDHTTPLTNSLSLPFTPAGIPTPTSIADYHVPQAISIPAFPTDLRPYRMGIPSLGLETPVKEVFVENGVWQVADYAVGYHHGTALPGEGNTVLAGHAGWRGSVFRNVADLQLGDAIFLDAGGWQYHYQVSRKLRVFPTQVEVMAPTEKAIVTLITCTDWDTKRLVVIAELVGSRPL
jgi:sortase A